MPRQRARRVEHLHQPLERQVLVAVGSQIGRPHPGDQLPEARIAGRIGAQHQRVDEEADQIVERAVGAPRYRAADRDVVAGTQPRQQSGQSSLQYHEQAGSALARQRQKTAVQFRRERERQTVAAMARHRRSRPVARQLDLLGKLFERAGPEGELARRSRSADRSPRPGPHAATACSRHIAPARPADRAPGRCGAPHRRAQGRAPAAPTTSRRPRCDAAAAAARARCRPSTNRCARSGSSPARSKPCCVAAARASESAAALTAVTTSRGRAASASRISCRGTPSVSGKTVRRLSCRATRSPSAASRAAWSSAPVSRTASGIV